MLSRHQLFAILVTMCVALLVSRVGAKNITQGDSGPARFKAPARPTSGAFHRCSIKLDYKDHDGLMKAIDSLSWPADPKELGKVVCQDRQATHICWASDCYVGQTSLPYSMVLYGINPLTKDGVKIPNRSTNALTEIWYPDSKYKPDLLVQTFDNFKFTATRAPNAPLPECYRCE